MARPARRKPAPSPAQLQMQVDAVPAAPPRHTPRAEQPAPPPLERSTYADEDVSERPPFGGWLTRQAGVRNDAMEMLVKAAKADRGFPKAGSPDDVRKYIGARGADPDLFEAIDDAELDWLAY